MLTIGISFLLIHLTLSDQWHSKSQCTQKEFANHMDIDCQINEFILIGWSHYGTKKSRDYINKCQPSENDCIMDYTHKIAELCNGISKCEVILTQQFIHKCADEATYLFVSYQCIQNSTIVDVCSTQTITTSNGISLISPLYPNEYPNNINCTCSIQSRNRSTVIIDVESLSFNLQDNDRLLSYSGTIPFGTSLLTEKNQINLKFQTDDTLSQSGFWIRVFGYRQCQNDEYNFASKCIRIFTKKETWNLAQERCLNLNSKLILLNDVIQEKKLAKFLSTNNIESSTSFWISNENENFHVYSWWPWRLSSANGNCVLRTQDGWVKRPCNEEQAFICERNINRQSLPLTVQCGNPPKSTIPSTKIILTKKTTVTTGTVTTTSMTTVTTNTPTSTTSFNYSLNDSFALPVLSTMNNRSEKSSNKNLFDPNILAAILGGLSIVILFINIFVCFMCKKRMQNQLKSKTQNDSNTSFTHEELQHSLMQHLYHEQTNTISSTSTSSSNSQSKSNDTTTSNLFQLISPIHPLNSSQSNTNPPSTLCFRNSHITNDIVDYHVYETIPAENYAYTIRTNHNTMKPVIQSNRSHLPRTNILYHPQNPSNPSYDTLPLNPPIIVPVCCHHYSPQCTNEAIGQHVLSSTTQQLYPRSESIV